MASSRSLRSKKRQTRLQFQPLPSSSPSQNNYSQAVQDRLANVRYEGAKSSRSGVGHTGRDRRNLPTPQPTSPMMAETEHLRPSSPLSSLRTSPAVPLRFAKEFYHSSSDEDDDEIVPPSSKRRRLHESRLDRNEMGNTTSVNNAVSSTRQNASRGNKSFGTIDATLSTPSRRSARLVNKASSPARSASTGSSQRLVSVDIPTPSKVIPTIASAETSDDDVMATQPASRRTKNKAAKMDPFVVEDEEVQYVSSEGEVVASKSSRKRQRNRDDFVVDNDEVEYITSNESIQGSSPSKSRKLPGQSRSSARKSQSRKRLEREQEEIAEDLLDLQDSEQETSTRRNRTRGGPVTTQRDKTKEYLEELKRRRAGERAPRIVMSDDENEDDGDDYDGVDINDIGKDNNRVEISDDSDVPAEGLSGGEPIYVDNEDDEDDFVVEDESATGGRFGRPATDLPLEFTSYASAKPRELFPHVIEWMVKNKISPAFGRHDELYNLSFTRLDDQVKAQAGSRLISSAWNATFKYAILARPGMKVTALDGTDEELIRTCDACNKSNHPARYDFQLSGKAYFKDTLEPIDEDDDGSDDEDGEEGDGEPQASRVSRDEQGHALASEHMHFYLGRFCAANAEMGHKLIHWKHHLNTQVLSYLEEQEVLSAEAIVAREKLSKKKREKEAESIVDMMEETGMITELWKSFQDDMEDARIGMEGHHSKGGRSKGRIGSVRVRRDDGVIGEWRDGGKFRSIATRLESDSEGE